MIKPQLAALVQLDQPPSMKGKVANASQASRLPRRSLTIGA
ncbi:hypothetical protein [Candidatus Burkholderia verschuerenii]|nr:hypothetical protein [Candidatus Burkholderia verschuerenii]